MDRITITAIIEVGNRFVTIKFQPESHPTSQALNKVMYDWLYSAYPDLNYIVRTSHPYNPTKGACVEVEFEDVYRKIKKEAVIYVIKWFEENGWKRLSVRGHHYEFRKQIHY